MEKVCYKMKQKKVSAKSIIIGMLGIVSGIVAIYFGIDVIGGGYHPESIKFGADFYTEIYSATQAVARNIQILIDAVGYVLVAGGLFEICYFLKYLCSNAGAKLKNDFEKESVLPSFEHSADEMKTENGNERTAE